MPGDRLARAYERLLLAYPRRYRRYRGAEMVTTLLDAAPSDRARPPVRQAAGLIAAGVACRLRPPRGVGNWLLAGTLALIFGGVLAVSGSWVGWHAAAPPLPDTATVGAISRAVVPVPPAGPAVRSDFLFDHPSDPGSGLTGDLTDGSVTLSYGAAQQRRNGPSVVGATVRRALVANGWTVDRFRYEMPRNPSVPFLDTGQPDPTTGPTVVVAHRESVHLVFSHGGPAAEPGATLRLSRAEPAAVPALAAFGAMAGLLMGWLLAGWLGRQARRCPLPQAAAVFVLVGLGLFACVPAAFFTLLSVVREFSDQAQVFAPWAVMTDPVLSLPPIAAAVLMATACALAAVPIRHYEPESAVLP